MFYAQILSVVKENCIHLKGNWRKPGKKEVLWQISLWTNFVQESATVTSLRMSKRILRVPWAPGFPNLIYGQVTEAECFRLLFLLNIIFCYHNDNPTLGRVFDIYTEAETQTGFLGVCQPYGTKEKVNTRLNYLAIFVPFCIIFSSPSLSKRLSITSIIHLKCYASYFWFEYVKRALGEFWIIYGESFQKENHYGNL